MKLLAFLSFSRACWERVSPHTNTIIYIILVSFLFFFRWPFLVLFLIFGATPDFDTNRFDYKSCWRKMRMEHDDNNCTAHNQCIYTLVGNVSKNYRRYGYINFRGQKKFVFLLGATARKRARTEATESGGWLHANSGRKSEINEQVIRLNERATTESVLRPLNISSLFLLSRTFVTLICRTRFSLCQQIHFPFEHTKIREKVFFYPFVILIIHCSDFVCFLSKKPYINK